MKEDDVVEAIVETDGSIQLLLQLAVDSALLEMLAGKQQLQDIAWSAKHKRKKAGKK